MSLAVERRGGETFDCRVAFADELAELARADNRIVAVCNDSVGSSNLTAFGREFPRRLVNVGIAEQAMVGVAAGLANGGMIPFVCGAAPFLTGRALEQIKADVAYSGYRVVLCGMSPGMAYGELGPTHHSIEDFAWLGAIADLPIAVPADPQQTRDAVRWAATASGPCYLRIGRFKVPAVTPSGTPFELGRAIVLREGADVTIVAVGTLVSRALDAAELLAADGVEATVVNATFVAPLDEATILRCAARTRRVVVAEEATRRGGLGAAVAQLFATRDPMPMRMLAVDAFAPTGSTAFLLEHFGLDAAHVAAAARELMR